MNNLRTGLANSYWQVTQPFSVYACRGFAESNTYFGSSMAYATVWERVTVPTGTTLYALPGGVFVALDGERVGVTVYPSDKHPFERTYMPDEERWPLENLVPTAPQELPPGGESRRFSADELVAIGAKRHGRGIDWIFSTNDKETER